MRPCTAVGLDVGTSKVCALVAAPAGNRVRVVGAGTAPAAGMRKGVVVHVEAAIDAIRQALAEASASAGMKIGSVSVGISGDHLRVMESSGAVCIRGGVITEEDRDRAADVAGAVYVPLDREVIHTLPAEFMIDGARGMADPVGMSGVRLETMVHIVTAATSQVRSLVRCCETAGVAVEGVMAQAAASGRAALTDEERHRGVVLVDMGGGATDIAFFREGRLRHVAVLGIGGNHVTSDVAAGLAVRPEEAERLKLTKGATCLSAGEGNEEITIGGDEERRVARSLLAAIIRPRCEEMIEMILAELQGVPGAAKAACGIVLTGGSSLLPGLCGLTAACAGMPVRIGGPSVLGGRAMWDGPQYASAVGLVLERLRGQQHAAAPAEKAGLFGRMKERLLVMTQFGELMHSYKKEGGIVCLRSRR